MAIDNNQRFVHLRVHSSYSLLEGAIAPKEMAALCQKYSMPAVAITDSGNLFGSLEFSQSAINNGVQPIIGCVVDVLIPSDNKKQIGAKNEYGKLLLIAKNEKGYRNLLKIVSQSFLETPDNEKPHVTFKDIEESCDGIIALTGGTFGIIEKLILEKQATQAEKLLLKLKDIFADNLYIEIMRHGTPEQEQTEEILLDWAYAHEIPFVATNDVYFADQSVHEAHDALMCIADGRYTSEEDRRKVNNEHYFKNTRQMLDLFRDIPEAIENTINIAKRCSVMSENHPPMLPHFDCEEGRTESDELRAQAEEGLKIRLEQAVFNDNHSDEEKEKITNEYFERLKFELDIIINMEFPGYFLIVSDFIKWSKANAVPVGPGRGSGAGSIVAWSLQITDLDPIRFGLLFERFLNPERVSMPDFDIDFCQERRELVIKYVQEKYGRDKVAQIITFGKLQARAVIRDVGRVLQMPYGQIDRISKMIPFNPIDPVTLSRAIDMDRSFKNMIEDDREIGHLVGLCLKLEGLNRHASTHAAGVVIGDRPLYELVPVYRDPRSDMPVCGYSMKYAEAAGLVKFDFLGLKTLTVIAKACQFIAQKGIDVDISKIPIDDKQTFEMLSTGDSIGVFQLESAGMRDTLRKMKPDNIEDIIALISLYRPGPMDNIPSYIARKHGTEEPDYLDPMLEEVLKETHGVIIYQEQVMQIAQIMGGYSLGAADLLRRAMGKKIASEMDKQREIFVEGAIKNKVDKKKASGIFDLVAKFAGYGFNKSHAAAYAMISYQTAYLKAHYPVEFLCASMNLEIGDTDKINTFRQEAVEQKIKVLPPNINESSAYFKPEKITNEDGKEELAIRYAFGALKNVGVNAMQTMQTMREKTGKFKDIFDYCSRFDSGIINKRQLESLIKAGAFDQMHKNRKQIFDKIEELLRYSAVIIGERNSSQNSLFGDSANMEEPKPKLEPTSDWKGIERMNLEFSAVGLYINQHPISSYKATLEKLHITDIATLNSSATEGSFTTKIAGVVISKRMRSSPRGRFATLSLSDPSGIFEVSVYNEDLLTTARDLMETGNTILIGAEVRKDDGGVRITGNSITDLDEVVSKHKLSLKIHLKNSDNLEELKSIFKSDGKGRTQLYLVVPADDKKVTVALAPNYSATLTDKDSIADLDNVLKVDIL